MTQTNFKVIGEFHGHSVAVRDKKDGSGTFTAGDALFVIDNSYEYQGRETVKLDIVPFNVFGKTAEKVLTLTRGEKMEITFQVEGTEYQGKNYPRIKAAFIHHVKAPDAPKKDGDIPF